MSGVRHHLSRVGIAFALLPLVAYAAGCAAPSASRNATPPKLHIGNGQAEARGAPMAAAGAGFGGYVLSGPLPTQPTHARVWHWPADQAATAADVTRLAMALGITATPQRHAHGWVVASPSGELRVRDGGGAQWSFVRADLLSCPPMMLDVDHGPGTASSSGCAVAVPSSGTPVSPGATTPPPPPQPPPPPPPGPDDATTRAAAQQLLAALGVAGTQRVEPGGPQVSILSVAPSLDSLPAQGIDVTIGVDSRGIRSATGYLQMPTKGDDYPLRSARSAFDDLAKLPRPMIAMYCGPAPSATSVEPVSCPTPEPTRVTGATLGLQLRWDGASNLLVPAWFFNTDGSTLPVAIVAVDPAFIDSPVAASPPVSTGGQVQTSPTSAPGEAPPSAPAPAAP